MVLEPLLTGDRLDDALDHESGIHETGDQGGQRAVNLPHARDKPGLSTGAFVGVAIQAPACTSARIIEHPAVTRQARREDGVLRRIDKDAARRQPFRDAQDQPWVVVDVVQNERAHHQVEPRGWIRHILERPTTVRHTRMGPFGSRESQHALRHVDAYDLGCPGRGEIVCELPGPAAAIQHPPAVYLGKERQQISMLHGPLPPGPESLEGRIAGEEARVVIYVLRFSRVFSGLRAGFSEVEKKVILVEEAPLPMQRARLLPPRPKPCGFVQPFRGWRGFRDAQLQVVQSPSASVLDGRIQERTTDALVPRAGKHVHPPNSGLVTLFHFGCPDQSDRANEVGSVELSEDGLPLMVAQGGSNGLEHETHILVGRRPECQRLCFQGHPTERDEGSRVDHAKPLNLEFRTHTRHDAGDSRLASRVSTHEPFACLRKMDSAFPARTVGLPPVRGITRTVRLVQQYARLPDTWTSWTSPVDSMRCWARRPRSPRSTEPRPLIGG